MSSLGLLKSYVLWKAALLVLAALCPGEDYDTSTWLLLDPLSPAQQATTQPKLGALQWAASAANPLLRRLVRWDAIYFTAAAKRGYLYEQETAFGWGFSRLVGLLATTFTVDPPIGVHAATAVLINLAAHFVSVLVLHRLCLSLFGSSAQGLRRASLVAHLHVLAPAGLFLIAPSGESMFALLSFLGFWLYHHGLQARGLSSDGSLVLAGIMYGLACTVRGNGVLNGLMFATDLGLIILGGSYTVDKLRRCCSLVLGGVFVAAGFAFPQSLAYLEYCWHEPTRPWCSATIPSIYGFVQKHYWNVGFLKYWTLSNAPLFLIAIPMLALMLVSSWIPLQSLLRNRASATASKQASAPAVLTDKSGLLWRLAIPQAMLTVLTLTNFHVQIITRISSGYILPYMLIAHLVEQPAVIGTSTRTAKAIVQWMVMYAIIQGGLYAAFLPPA